MKGDFTRSTFDPAKRYTGVRQQQGRVQLDADANEQVEIDAHLRETALAAVIGPCGAPLDEDGGGFRLLVVDGGAALAVTPGRMWVDGVLCEATPSEGQTFRRLTDQEDFPGFEPPTGDGRYLVYLDVWQRHVTALEDPSIREAALGGPDTATRTRTVSQVRSVAVSPDTECADPLPVAPPTGRLRARARPGDEGGPCIVPEAAGYRRLENQLYRVEVHRGGELGGAGDPPTFEWSRDNGSIVTEWLESDGQEVTVGSVGRDRVLGFADAEWVELTDDHDELDGRPGTLARVEDVGESTLTLAAAPGDPPPAERHPKVRRWDTRGAAGDVEIAAAPDDDSWTPLEAGIEVDFTPGTYRTGDWWWIPARAFVGELAGEIEWPEDGGGQPRALPPAGIEHHLCPLGLVDLASETFVDPPTDCRPTFWPLTRLRPGCCTVVVRPGGDVQAALDSLPAAGGCVCLKTGVHQIDATLRIERSDVVLHGEGPGAVVRSRRPEPLLRVASPRGATVRRVRVEELAFELARESEAQEGQALVEVERGSEIEIVACRAGSEAAENLAGFRVARSAEVRVERCRTANLPIGAWVDVDSTRVSVVDSHFVASTGNDGRSFGLFGILFADAFGPATIAGNEVVGFASGIRLDAAPLGERPASGLRGAVVVGNRVVRGPSRSPGLRPYGIDVAGHGCRVEDNVLAYDSHEVGGIRLSGVDGRVVGNRLDGPRLGGEGRALAIAVGWEGDLAGGFGDRATVSGNRIGGVQDGIVVLGADGCDVEGNRLSGTGPGWAIGVGGGVGGRVAGNRVRGAAFSLLAVGADGLRVEDNELVDGSFGVAVAGGEVTVRGNRVEAMRGPGIVVASSATAALAGNRVAGCAYEPQEGVPAAGVILLGTGFAEEARVESCEVLDTGVDPEGEVRAQPAWGIAAFAHTCVVHGNRVAYADPERLDPEADNRALVLLGPPAFTGDRPPLAPGAATVSDNRFTGRAGVALVWIGRLPVAETVELRFERATFADNVCRHFGNVPGVRPRRTVLLEVVASSVTGNQVQAFERDPFPSFDFGGVGTSVFLGNVHHGIAAGPADLRPPNVPNDFNHLA